MSVILFILQRIFMTNIILSNNEYDASIACLLMSAVKKRREKTRKKEKKEERKKSFIYCH